MLEQGARPVQDVLDVGAATGLSSQELQRAFPVAAVTALDLSPHMLAVGAYLQRQRQQQQQQAGAAPPRPLRFVHGKGEDTGLPDASYDLISVMLVRHGRPCMFWPCIFF